MPNLRLGRRHRSIEQTTLPGGKGVNIARALKRLGRPVIATGFAGGPTGTRIVEALTGESILNDFVRIAEESRTNMSVLDPTNGQQTEINERGPNVTPQEVELFVDKLLYLAQGARMCVFAGSLPHGVEPDLYARLIRELHKMGVHSLIDSDGDPLQHAVRAGPEVVSPNAQEAEELVDHEFNDDDDRVLGVHKLAQMGAREAIMTVADGCFARVLESGSPAVYRVSIKPQEARAAVGSGDAFLAGYAAARYVGKEPLDCLKYGVACGAESTQHFGAGVIEPHAVERILADVETVKLELPVNAS